LVRRPEPVNPFPALGLAMDLYLPAGRDPGARLPAVLLVHGEAPPEALRGVRGWGQYGGWGRLLAAEGLAGVAAEHRAVAEAGFEGVVSEVGAALANLRDRAGELGLDPDRLAVAGFSAGVPLTMAALAAGPARTAPTSTPTSTPSWPPPAPPACPSSWSSTPTATTPSTSSTTPTPPAPPSAGCSGSSASGWPADRRRPPVGWPWNAT
jgi:fermentation-respiration switch protein FrsA (DUF1100 family)